MRNEIDNIIAEARKNGNKEDLKALVAIKAAFTAWLTREITDRDKYKDRVMTDDVELDILLEMKKQHEDSIEQYEKGGRNDLAEAEKVELDALTKFMPKLPTKEDIEAYTKEVCESLKASNGSVSMKDMKYILSEVQKKYPTAEGKVVSGVVKSIK